MKKSAIFFAVNFAFASTAYTQAYDQSNGQEVLLEKIEQYEVNDQLYDQASYEAGFEAARNSLVGAAALGNGDSVAAILQEGVSVNALDSRGHSALMKAASAGDQEMLTLLLANGANPNLKGAGGNTALHYAALKDQDEAINLLLANGADKEVRNDRGDRALEDAIGEQNVAAIMALDPNLVEVEETEAGFFAIFPAIAGFLGTGGAAATVAAATATGVVGVAIANDDDPSDGGNGGGGDGPGDGGDGFLAEYNNQPGLAQVNTLDAYEKGLTGEGITVAVVDSGVHLEHSEIADQLSPQSGITFNGGDGSASSEGDGNLVGADENDNEINGRYWNGTAVAGVIAAERNEIAMHGVAYDAKILPVNAYTYSERRYYDADIAAGIDYAVSKDVDVINLSLGSPSEQPKTREAIVNAVQKDDVGQDKDNSVLVVSANGRLYFPNESEAQFNNPYRPAAYAGDADINSGNVGDALNARKGIGTYDGNAGALLAVGAVDQKNQLASYSNPCGDAKNWCLVAPGSEILTTTPGDNVTIITGTAMAAGHVSGAAALVKQNDPFLTGREVAEILLLTADPLSGEVDANGVNKDWGHGLLNIDKATQPVGDVAIPTTASVNGNSINVSNTAFSTSSAFGDALSGSNVSFTVLDSYDRAFDQNISDLTNNIATGERLDTRFRNFGNDVTQNKKEIAEGISFASDTITDRDVSVVDGQEGERRRVSFSAKFDKNSFDFNHNVNLQAAFHPLSFGDMGRKSSNNMGTNSVLGLVSDGTSSRSSFKLNKLSSFSFGTFDGENEFGDVRGVVSEYNREFTNGLNLGFQLGMMNEENSFLGSNSQGAFELAGDTSTWFYNLAGSKSISDTISFFGSANYGISFAEAAQSSLINDISQIESFSFSMGVAKSGLFKESDSFEFVMSQPLRIQGGNANLTLPVGRDNSGNIFQNNYSLNLSPSGREMNYGMFYSYGFEDLSKLNVGLIHRTEPGHNKDADDDSVAMLKYDYSF